MNVLYGYATGVAVVRVALFWIAVALLIIAGVDWAVRTRRISPFSGIARFCRARVDPLLHPVEGLVLRAGGQPAMAPWWMLLTVIVAGLVLLWLLDLIGGTLATVMQSAASPRLLPALLVNWAFDIIEFAIIVRVIASWFRLSAWSRWVRWSFVLTEWLMAPLRRVIPPMGMFDLTPLVAYFILWLIQSPVVGLVARLSGAGLSARGFGA